MSESIGSKLKQRREMRHLSIGQVAEQTRIRAHYLQALEGDDLSEIPSMVQARGFLRIYAEFLGLDLDELPSASRSPESQPTAASPAPTAEPALAPAQPTAPAASSQPRPGFMSSLRQRFARHPSAAAASPEAEPVVPSEAGPEAEVFVPVRVHEELPAEPAGSSAPGPTGDSQTVAKPARIPRSSSRKKSARKPARTKAKKSTAKSTKPSRSGADGKAHVKKKMTE
ncbi:MAG TPA: helix-turn-helix transcriptional regulator [Anaerolineales bacterium]|nr:helix-turn-helix transcriptional regulator [Anaerolineales bacterium]